ncbi:hypothetical protein Dsin_003151 [Dipteronia sinensis]|uniref:PUM-HD domain-containing protein n=1 Tax=Dipteronia sinensis TaxID=43782 RepID=A0AAE0B8G8_9ROSI|nr:hypothetical protein Dsin_003151 [Dipteronia sinensis]
MAIPHHRYRSSSSQFSDEMNRIFAAPAYTHSHEQSAMQNPLHHPVNPRLENGETLESVFSRLSVVNGLNKYSGLDNASVFYDYREVGCSPFDLQETEHTHHQGSPGCSSNDFVSGFYSTSNNFSRTSLNQNGFLFDSGNGELNNSRYSITTTRPLALQEIEQTHHQGSPGCSSSNDFVPGFYSTSDTFSRTSLNQNGFLCDSGNSELINNRYSNTTPAASNRKGFFNGLVSKKQNVMRSSLSRPQWLQEPLDGLSLRDWRGHFLALAKDHTGCRFLQKSMTSTTKEELDMIFLELIDHVCDLMVDPFGNYVLQKLVEVCSDEQRTHILLMLTKNNFQLVRICLDMHGTRAVQRLMENLTTPQQISLVTAALSTGAVALTKDMNGHHVIQHCLKYFSDEDNKYLLNELANNCYGIGTDKSGCCVLQHCVQYSKGEPRERLVAEIIANALHLADDHYGNYVVQHLLEMKVPQITVNLLRQLEGHYASLSCNKYGSNVVEKCLKLSGEQESMRIIMELLRSPNASRLIVDPYGNYVIQSALSVSKQGFLFDALVNLVKINFQVMRNNIYGRKVVAWFEKNKLHIYR